MKTGHVTRELTEAAPVIGWRVWIVTATTDGLRLGSVLHDQVWAPGTTALASCQRHEGLFAEPLPPHQTPSPVCGCGFHAARDPVDALSYLRGRDETATICRLLGEVALWGRLVETGGGWRAAAAYPVRLYVADEAIAEALGVYGVPLMSTVKRPALAGDQSNANTGGRMTTTVAAHRANTGR
jgi:hypothetical protein